MSANTTCLTLMLAGALATISCHTGTQGTTVPRVSACELMAEWERYDGKEVETEAALVKGSEAWGLFDWSCSKSDRAMYWDPDSTWRGSSDAVVVGAVDELLRARGIAPISVRGVFHGPRKYVVPPGVPSALAEKFRTKERYGHMAADRFMFQARRIERVLVNPGAGLMGPE